MKKFALCLFFICQWANAELVAISDVVPINWRIQNYLPGNVVLWFTGSSCANGMMLLPASATPADHARLYSTVVSAKAMNAKIFVYYDNGSGNCWISSFGFV